MNLKLFKAALPWLVLALLIPVLALSLTAGTVKADCGCGGGSGGATEPPATRTVRVDVSPEGTGDISVEGRMPSFYPSARAVTLGGNIDLEAWPADGYYFVGWGGDLSGNDNPINITVRGDMTITAHFFPEELFSPDARLHLVFPIGTVVQDEYGEPLDGLEIDVDETPLPSPPEANLIGLPYELGPDGTSFDQPVSLSCCYDSAQIPDRVAEEELYLAYYDVDRGLWRGLTSMVDAANDVVSALVDHLSIFSVIAPNPPPLPADFASSQLNISPLEVDVDQEVAISVLVTNSGEAEGRYEVVLTVNGVAVEARWLTMAGGSQTVSFSTSGDEAGSYSVDVNGLEGSFTVLEPPLLPIELPKAVGWVILGLVLAALGLGAVIFQIVKIRRSYY